MSVSKPFPNKQLFGWTDPETPTDSYVGYVAVHSHPCDTIMIAVRGHRSADGAPVSIALPMNEALALAQSINAFANEVNYPPDAEMGALSRALGRENGSGQVEAEKGSE